MSTGSLDDDKTYFCCLIRPGFDQIFPLDKTVDLRGRGCRTFIRLKVETFVIKRPLVFEQILVPERLFEMNAGREQSRPCFGRLRSMDIRENKKEWLATFTQFTKMCQIVYCYCNFEVYLTKSLTTNFRQMLKYVYFHFEISVIKQINLTKCCFMTKKITSGVCYKLFTSTLK